MHGRNKKIIKLKLDAMCAKSKLILFGQDNIDTLLNDLVNEIMGIAESLVCYGKFGAELIDKLGCLSVDIENIRLICKKRENAHIKVANLIFHIKKINDMVEKNIPNKLVLFLPYKASMWDSLESIWLAAEQDASCRAIVMPIPYFDRAYDGSFKSGHWEGNDFPIEVPITDYRIINLQKIYPDEIFIHNPYDGYNRITSVHPEYYSDKLKEYTKKLIYVPYFVANESTANPAWAKAHAQMPVFVYADIVVLQSNKMRDIFIESLVNLYGEKSRKIWEKKIKGWGSPKLEKAAIDKIDEREIPKSWRKKIIKADGTWKKIIMYGTGLSEMLGSGERLLDKIENTITFFSKRSDAVAILWRPHPLILATLESMRPESVARYKKIIDEFKEADWGIFDDTTDLHRSISISDAYYGDDSSVIQLFQVAGKPVMLESLEIMN